MKASVLPPWDGKTVPTGQQCKLHGGNGATPPIKVTGLPAGTRWIVVEFNDKSYTPLSTNGGHGKIGFPVSGASATLPSVPGMTAKLPGGAVVVAKARSSGRYASPGYLPPCSGGKGNRYSADVKALDADNKVLEKISIGIGRY
ncbi:MAG: hypothetical protein K8F59_04715 [Rhodobacteraceae bacterium]|nr:hypothetical protein [Paracoccaceae bacterium]